jgi:pimeloyl-ACP methyl ester carboxylesterase
MLATITGAKRLHAEPASDSPAPAGTHDWDAAMSLLNKTSGGKQFWADVWLFHDWRIQRHALTGHYRLIDGTNYCHLSGTYQACREMLDKIRDRDQLPPMQGKAVVILHGLFRTRSAMSSLRAAITATGEYKVFCMGYPTTRGCVQDHAQSLESVVRSLEGLSELNFIGHSLGNLVVRHWLKDRLEAGQSLPEGQSFGRMVMLAPPNHQPQIATKLIRGSVIPFVTGAASQELATGWEELAPKLATPHFEFGILAGGRGDDRGYNPLLPGDDDGVVTVESTRLAGARDFRRLPVLHSFFMNNKQVQEFTVRFLSEGHFESDDKRQAVVAD